MKNRQKEWLLWLKSFDKDPTDAEIKAQLRTSRKSKIKKINKL